MSDQRRTPPGYGVTSRIFHWLVAAMVFVTIPVAIAMTSEGFGSIGDQLYITHKGLGVVILVTVLARVGWRFVVPPPPMSEEMPDRERWLANASHVLLYLLLVFMAVTGYLRTVAGGFPVELLDWLGVPPLIDENESLAAALSTAHAFGAYLLVAMIAMHVGAILHHTFVLRDGTLRRMWPPVGGDADDDDDGSAESRG